MRYLKQPLALGSYNLLYLERCEAFEIKLCVFYAGDFVPMHKPITYNSIIDSHST